MVHVGSKAALLPVALLAAALTLAVPSARPSAEPAPVAPRLAWEVVSRRLHDPDAWTQGLALDATGRLFESTGLIGRTSLRELDPLTGQVLRLAAPPEPVFGEGLALVDERLVQLTWRDGVALVWSVDRFAIIARHAYEGEGWGLCHDGERLIMSDGSASLTFRDPASFEVTGRVDVTLDGEPVVQLNELECLDARVWANVWQTDRIVRIDPDSGRVDGVLDLGGLLEPHPATLRRGADLNGIAADRAAHTLLVTGKLWPELIEIRLVDDEAP